MDLKNAVAIFEGKEIRKVWHQDEWWFSVFDIVEVLTGSSDPKQYIKKMRQRDSALDSKWGTICTPLELVAPDNKRRKTNCVNTEGAFRLIQSIPSVKAEPFKLWLAKVGYERIKEIENPEIGQDRIKRYYELKGYPKDWIDKRMRGIAIRQELTDEWKIRNVGHEKEYAILTNEISKAAFGKTVQEYKEFKRIENKNHNLRDHMTDWELILTMVGEKATTDITVSKDSKGFDECKVSAQKGGKIAHNTRKEIEQETGKTIVSEKNFLGIKRKKSLQDKKNNS